MTQKLFAAISILLVCHQPSASLFSWGSPPSTAAPTPCGISPVAIDPELNTTIDAAPEQVVWEVSVMTKGMGATWRHTCGGALVTNQAVLTSASCVDGYVVFELLHFFRN